MLSQPDGPFINIAKLNLSKYAQRQNLAKVTEKITDYYNYFIFLYCFEYFQLFVSHRLIFRILGAIFMVLLTQLICNNFCSNMCLFLIQFFPVQVLFEYIFHHENDVRNVSRVQNK